MQVGDQLGSFISANLKVVGRDQIRFARLMVILDVAVSLKSKVWLGNIE